MITHKREEPFVIWHVRRGRRRRSPYALPSSSEDSHDNVTSSFFVRIPPALRWSGGGAAGARGTPGARTKLQTTAVVESQCGGRGKHGGHARSRRRESWRWSRRFHRRGERTVRAAAGSFRDVVVDRRATGLDSPGDVRRQRDHRQ